MTRESIESSSYKDVRRFLNPIDIEEGIRSGRLNDVRIERHSGEIEGGWQVAEFNFKTGEVLVCKPEPEGEKFLRKNVPLKKLSEWN